MTTGELRLNSPPLTSPCVIGLIRGHYLGANMGARAAARARHAALFANQCRANITLYNQTERLKEGRIIQMNVVCIAY